jgi:all-trans-retinol 13,14-reductase
MFQMYFLFLVFLFIYLTLYILRKIISKNNVRLYPPILKDNNWNKDKFALSKIPENIDTIIIGSGISGLTLGCMLAETGKQILIIEQHYLAGGTLHQYEEKGYSWETGIHYIGGIGGYILKIIKRYISDFELVQIPTHFDRIIVNQNKSEYDFPVSQGWDTYKHDLCQQFPEYASEICEYIKQIRYATTHKWFFIIKFLPKKLRKYLYWGLSKSWYFVSLTSWSKTIDIIFSKSSNSVLRNDRYKALKKILLGQSFNAGSDPETIPLFIAGTVLNHYLNKGGFYPSKGTNNIVNVMIQFLHSKGCRVLVGKEIDRLIIENNKITGIIVNNTIVKCDRLVYSGGIGSLLKILHHPQTDVYHLSVESREWIKTIENICFKKCPGKTKYNTLFIGLKKSIYFGYHNTWIHNDNSEISSMFIGSSEAKIKNGITKTIVILVPSSWECVEEYENDTHKNRHCDYQKYKEEIKEKILKHIGPIYPEIKDNIDFVSVSTPLTYNYYFKSIKGEAYGLEMNLERLTPFVSDALAPTTPINGLFLSGQDSFTLGFTGAINSSLATYAHMEGYISLLSKLL